MKKLLLLAAVALVAVSPARASGPLPAGFTEAVAGPGGGQIWRGVIPGASRESGVYLPPGYSAERRYPVVYLLSGLPGTPWEYIDALSLAAVADSLIGEGQARPFVAVIPVAGPDPHAVGEWAGPFEDYVVREVVPWVDAHLPTIATGGGRTIAGLSAGGYGAVDIALRHPSLFGRVESWGGYFKPFRDGVLARADESSLDAHDPKLLVRAEAPLLRRLATRFYLSTGPGHGVVSKVATLRFARELGVLGLPYRLVVLPSRQGEWETQLVAGLRWAMRYT